MGFFYEWYPPNISPHVPHLPSGRVPRAFHRRRDALFSGPRRPGRPATRHPRALRDRFGRLRRQRRPARRDPRGFHRIEGVSLGVFAVPVRDVLGGLRIPGRILRPRHARPGRRRAVRPLPDQGVLQRDDHVRLDRRQRGAHRGRPFRHRRGAAVPHRLHHLLGHRQPPVGTEKNNLRPRAHQEGRSVRGRRRFGRDRQGDHLSPEFRLPRRAVRLREGRRLPLHLHQQF